MNVSEAIKIKRQIQSVCNIETKMLDIPAIGLVLTVERNSITTDSYKLLADFADQNNFTLQLEMGKFIISNNGLPTSQSPRTIF